MNLTLTAITTAVVTACFVTAGVKDEAPVFAVDVNTEAVVSIREFKSESIDNTLESLLTTGFVSVISKNERPSSQVNTVVSSGVISIPPMKTLQHLVEKVSTEGSIVAYSIHKETQQVEELSTVGYASPVLGVYKLQALDAYFKHPSTTYPHMVVGYYNKTVVFGSRYNINTSNVLNTLETGFEIDFFHLKSIPPQVDLVVSSFPNTQLYYKEKTIECAHTVSTNLIARDPSNISPYRKALVTTTLESSFNLLTYVQDERIQNKVNTVESNGTLSIMPYKLTSVVASLNSAGDTTPIGGLNINSGNNVDSLNSDHLLNYFAIQAYTGINNATTEGLMEYYYKYVEISPFNLVGSAGQSDIRFGEVLQISRTESVYTDLGNFKIVYNPGMEPVFNTTTSDNTLMYYIKHTEPVVTINTLSSNADTSFIVDKPVYYTQEILSDHTLHAVVIEKTATNNINTMLSDVVESIFYKDPVIIEAVNNSLETVATLDLFKIGPFTALNNVNTLLENSQIRVKDMVINPVNTLVTAYAIQYQVENIVDYGIVTVVTYGTIQIEPYKLASSLRNDVATDAQSDIRSGSVLHISRTESVTSALGGMQYVRNPGLNIVLNTLVTNSTTGLFAKHTNLTNNINTTVTTLGDAQYDVVAPVTITLDRQGGTGGTTSIVSVAGFSITPESVTIPTRTHYNFQGYFTGVGGVGQQRINSSGIYVALTNSTYTSDVILYAHWTDVLYTITWKAYSGSTLKTETLAYGSTSTAPIGTSDTTSYDYSWPKASTTVVGTETITETRVGQPYTVTFNGNGGGTPSPTSKVVIYNNTYGTLATVSRTNWEFIGWFTAASGGTKRTSSDTMLTTSNHTLYAHWNPTVASGLLHTTATSALCNIHVEHIDILGYVQTVSTSLGGAQYENQTAFNITLNANGGTNGNPTSITGLTGISINPASITPATRTNYTITGYYTTTSGGTKYINADGTYNNLNSNTFIGNVTLYAQWTMNNVYFDWNPTPSTVGLRGDIYVGGVLQEDNSLDWYQTRPANSVFKVAGLTIPPGWVYSSYTTTRLTGVTVAGSGATTEVQGTGDMTQTAARAIAITITASTYTITVAQNGGTGSSANISSYQPKTSATTITMTRGTYTNYRFSHWSVSGANGQATVSGSTITIPTYTTTVQPYGNLTITANWKPATTTALNTLSTSLGDAQYAVATPFTITLDRQSGSGGTASITCVNGFYLDPTSATVPTRTAYTFGGYYTAVSGGGTQCINASGTYVGLTNTTFSAATTLYAKWTLITYTLTNDRNGGTGGNNSNTYNITTSSTLATLLGTVTRTGYTFSSWMWTSATAGGWTNGSTYASSTNVSGKYASGTLQAQWTANSYTVTFNANGGGTPSPTSKSVTYGSTYGTLATVSRTGYTFNGWFTATSGGTQVISTTAVAITANQTLYAQWTINTYTVTWKNWDGTTLKTESVAYGGNGTPPAQPTRTGFTFSYWSGTYTNVTSNRTITAVFVVNSYVLRLSSITNLASQTVTRTSSPNKGASTGVLSDYAVIYYGDTLTIAATASTYYSASVSGSPVTVTGNVTTSNHITINYAPVLNTADITFYSDAVNALHFLVENPNPYAVRMYFEVGDSTPDANYVDIAASGSTYVTVSGLNPYTSYTTYFQAVHVASGQSSVVRSITRTTPALSAPTTSYIGNATDSITLRITNPNPVSVTLYYDDGVNPPTANSDTIGASTYKDITFSGLSPNTAYYLYSRFYYGGAYSAVKSDYYSTQSAGATSWSLYGWSSSSGTLYSYNLAVSKAPLTSCPLESAVASWLATNYPASNYATGYRIRVYQGKKPSGTCGWFWYDAV